MNNRFFPNLIILALLLWTATGASAWSRAYSPTSDYVRRATLIAIVDAGPRDARGQTALVVREVLKGEAKDDLVLQQSLRMGPTVPPDVRGWAALFETDARGERQIIETYNTAEQIEALREVVKIAVIASERGRLEAWRALLPDSNPLYGENFLWELRQMRDANNFPLLLDSLDEFDDAAKLSLVRLVGEIGDARGVSWLLERLNVTDATPAQQKMAREAANQLGSYFPDAPGVAEAFRVAAKTDYLKDTANYYLAQRDSVLRAAFQTQTPYLSAQSRAKAGDLVEARRLWLEILEDPTTTDWMRLDVAASLAKTRAGASEADLGRERRLVLPFLGRLAREGDYSQTESAAKIVRDWHHSDAIEPLLAVLERKSERIFENAQRIAFAGLSNLGPQARKQAATVLKARLQSEKSTNIDSFDSILMPLCWLGDASSDAQIVALLDDYTRPQWENLAPLREAARAPDETAALIALLQKPNSLPYNAFSWLIMRLGEKRDPRALAPLSTFLAQNPYQFQPETSEAIIRIGGPQAEEEVVRLLRHPDANARRSAVDLIVQLQGARALPLLRRMINEPNFGLRSQAFFQLAYIGTPDDVPLLLHEGDYWTGDRANHYWIVQAVANIRARFQSEKMERNA